MPPQPLTFLAISQNIGSIDCSHIKSSIPDDIKIKTRHFLASLSEFIKDAARAKQKQFCDPSLNSAFFSSSSNEKSLHTCVKLHHELQSSSAAAESEVQVGTDDCEVDVIVLHVQEIGGKKHNTLFNEFLGREVTSIWPSAGWCSGLLMQQQNCDCTFTAMGVVIFLSRRVVPIASVLSVRHRTYVAVADDPISYTGGQPSCLFLGGKFSNAEKSRKGYLLTSLRIGSTCINFVNLHLYHDADNSTAAAESPSRYTPRRVEAFLEAMAEVVPVLNPEDPLLIFGDFNTRLDAKQTLEYLTTRLGLPEGAIKMGKKEVTAPDSFWSFFASRDNHRELQQFDREPAMLMDALAIQSGMELCELPVHFPPTYMFEDESPQSSGGDALSTQGGSSPTVTAIHPPSGTSIGPKKARPYKRERLPAWCDRLFLNTAALELITGAVSTQQHAIRKQNSSTRLTRGASQSGGAIDPSPFASAATGSDSRGGVIVASEGSTDAACVYDSASLECMDHEAVFLLF